MPVNLLATPELALRGGGVLFRVLRGGGVLFRVATHGGDTAGGGGSGGPQIRA